MQSLHIIAGIAYDPTIRGLLSVGVGVVVLMGSVYLILGTNTGNRMGFLLSAAGFFGWMAIMGVIWWIYGIGMLGTSPSWQVVEYNEANLAEAGTEKARDINLSVLPTSSDATNPEGVDFLGVEALPEEDPDAYKALGDRFEEASNGWEFLPASNPARGEAEATVSAELPECATCPFGIESPADYIVLGAYETGGKEGLPDDPTRIDRIKTQVVSALTIKNPTRYAVVQVQKVIEQELVPGQAPPRPVADADEPVISVIMIRDIGDRRFPSAVITISSTLIFALLCWVLHQRERILQANVAHAEAVAAGRA